MAEQLNLNADGVVLEGYDPVSYFVDQPTAGNPEIRSTYKGATYLFASTANQALFDADPEKYVPQYGGFCALAVSEGKTFGINPETYQVRDGKLYLFYNGELGNTKLQWEADEVGRREAADGHWAKGNLPPLSV